MTNEREFSDEELVAFLDGEVEFCCFEELNRTLRVSPEIVKRLDGLCFDKAGLCLGFTALALAKMRERMPQYT